MGSEGGKMTPTRKANIMFAMCSAMALLNAVAGLYMPFFGVAAVLWALGAVSYYFMDFDGRGRR